MSERNTVSFNPCGKCPVTRSQIRDINPDGATCEMARLYVEIRQMSDIETAHTEASTMTGVTCGNLIPAGEYRYFEIKCNGADRTTHTGHLGSIHASGRIYPE
ncbi:MAG: hypothetical protein U0525_05890 [Patescibacteria group bacterium]